VKPIKKYLKHCPNSDSAASPMMVKFSERELFGG